MNLSDDLRSLADELDKLAGLDLATMGHDALKLTIRSYAFALRAMAGSAVPVESPEDSNRRMIEKARAELRKARDGCGFVDGRLAEEGAVSMMVCVGGPADGDAVEMPSSMPLGAFTRVMGVTYKLMEDGKLHKDEENEA